jgi:hypothetical protein
MAHGAWYAREPNLSRHRGESYVQGLIRKSGSREIFPFLLKKGNASPSLGDGALHIGED